jgi:hypothetical protein
MMKLKNGQEGCFLLISPRAVRRYSTLADGWIFQYEQPSKLSDGIQPCVLIASMSTPIGGVFWHQAEFARNDVDEDHQ